MRSVLGQSHVMQEIPYETDLRNTMPHTNVKISHGEFYFV